MIEWLDQWDKILLRELHAHFPSGILPLMSFFSSKILWFFFGIWVLFKLRNRSRGEILSILLLFGFTILISDRFSSGFMKPFFGRLRPCHQPELLGFLQLYEGKCGGKYGFVSSHAANIVGWVVLCFRLFSLEKIEKIGLVALAFLISVSRVFLGVHFWGDVLVGALIGVFSAYFAFWIYKSVRKPKKIL